MIVEASEKRKRESQHKSKCASARNRASARGKGAHGVRPQKLLAWILSTLLRALTIEYKSHRVREKELQQAKLQEIDLHLKRVIAGEREREKHMNEEKCGERNIASVCQREK